MLKKASHLILAASVVLSVSACSSGNKESGGTNPTTDSNSEASTKTEKIYFYANGGQVSQTKMSKPEDLELVKQAIIDKIGIEVVPIIPPKGTEEEKLNILLASNEPLDVFLAGKLPNFQSKGALMPLNDLLDKYGANIRKLWPEDWATSWDAVSTPDKKIWGIPRLPAIAGNTVYMRTDWLSKLGLQMPTTIDELENVLKTFKEKDPAGSGQTIPLLTNLSGLNNSLAAGFMGTGYGNWIDTDGKVKPAVMHPGYKEFLAKMADWYQKGYIFKEAFSAKNERITELVKQNRAAGFAGWYSSIAGNESALQQNEPNAKYEVAAELKGPKGYVTSMGGIDVSGWAISKSSKNAETVIKYIDWLHSDIENYFLAFYGIEGKHWKYVDKEKRVLETLNTDYAGEFVIGSTFAYTVQFESKDPVNAPQFDYMRKYITDTKRALMPGDAEEAYKYDNALINEQVPALSDLTRMMEEEVTKFIMGARPMSEYDKFLQELNHAGMDKWIEVYTDQNMKVKAAK
ncbi:extracellular solute-binding protein [Paenibacillus nasutitermitis]|uniref:ABC transporter substrate-binding protein n=1 Tax=Paenibacillus nasutitermitis TaxID=1652958 RepID=A0A916YLC4_9BACL|nr:extracellular solute-binding protein [Paenibacillus nasutitermitis]GGD50880.1 ABC transporter substrate-binding protein [Paenibacillus nasutitermitis]